MTAPEVSPAVLLADQMVRMRDGVRLDRKSVV